MGSIGGAIFTPTDIGSVGLGTSSTPLFQQIQPDAAAAGDFGALGAGTPVGSGLITSGTTEALFSGGSTTPVSSLVSGGAPGGAAGAAPTAATQAGQAQQAMQKGC